MIVIGAIWREVETFLLRISFHALNLICINYSIIYRYLNMCIIPNFQKKNYVILNATDLCANLNVD